MGTRRNVSGLGSRRSGGGGFRVLRLSAPLLDSRRSQVDAGVVGMMDGPGC